MPNPSEIELETISPGIWSIVPTRLNGGSIGSPPPPIECNMNDTPNARDSAMTPNTADLINVDRIFTAK